MAPRNSSPRTRAIKKYNASRPKKTSSSRSRPKGRGIKEAAAARRRRNTSTRTRSTSTRSPGRELAAKNTAKRAGKKAVAAAKSKRVNATSPSKRRGYDNARIRGAQAAKRRGPDKPKKDTRTRGGQSSDKYGNDQVAFQRFINMTPAQQRYVMNSAAARTRRKAR